MVNRGLSVKANIFEDPLDEDEEYIEEDFEEEDVDDWIDGDEEYDDEDTGEFSWEWNDDEE